MANRPLLDLFIETARLVRPDRHTVETSRLVRVEPAIAAALAREVVDARTR